MIEVTDCEKILGVLYEKKFRKTKQKKFRIEKVQRGKVINFVKWNALIKKDII